MKAYLRVITVIVLLAVVTSCGVNTDKQIEATTTVEENGEYNTDTITKNVGIPLIYENARGFSDGLAGVKFDGRWGYIDYNNNLIIPCEYDSMRFSPDSHYDNFVGAFNDGLAPVIKNGKVGYINKQNGVVIPFIYDYAYNFTDGLAKVYNENEGYGYIDTSGNVVIPLMYDKANDFKEGLASVKKGDYFGYIDKNGKEVIEFKYKSASDFSDGLAVVSEDDKTYKYIDKDDSDVFGLEFETANNFNEGYAVVENVDDNGERTFTVIDKDGNTIFFTKDYYITKISDGLIVAQEITQNGQNGNQITFGKSGYLDLNCKEVIPFIYAITTDFCDGVGGVVDGEQKLSFIDKTGKRIVDDKYDFEYETDNIEMSENFIVVHRDGKYGFVNFGE